jgi:hypothetical protein
MSKKKRSPVVEMTGQILDEIQEHNTFVRGHKDTLAKLLQKVEWNLVQSNTFSDSPNIGQALGLVRGALLMLGKETG